MAAMEDVLDLYAEPYDPNRPVVCFDETDAQLLACWPKPGRRGQPGADAPSGGCHGYVRTGTHNLFLL